jgi:hypothetical protein
MLCNFAKLQMTRRKPSQKSTAEQEVSRKIVRANGHSLFGLEIVRANGHSLFGLQIVRANGHSLFGHSLSFGINIFLGSRKRKRDREAVQEGPASEEEPLSRTKRQKKSEESEEKPEEENTSDKSSSSSSDE